MQQSVEQMVEDFRRASEELRREIGHDPVKAKAFLDSLKDSYFKPTPRSAPTDGQGRTGGTDQECRS